MKYRRFGRTNWQVSEIGYGMWGMGGWTGSDDQESIWAAIFLTQHGGTAKDTVKPSSDRSSGLTLIESSILQPRSLLKTSSGPPGESFPWTTVSHPIILRNTSLAVSTTAV